MIGDLLALMPLAGLVVITTVFSELAVRKSWIPYWISRKILHIVAIGSCAIAPYFLENHKVLIAIVLPAWLLLLWLVSGKQLMREENGRPAWGIVWFPPAYLLLLAITKTNASFFVVYPMLVLAIADPLATIFGKCFAKRHYQLTGEPKSFIGNLGCILGFILVVLICYAYEGGNWPPAMAWPTIVAGAVLISVAEALGSYGKDNFYVPLLSLPIFALLHCYSQPPLVFPTLVLATVPFVIWAFRRQSLTLAGALSAGILGVLSGSFAGKIGLLPLLLFFASSIAIGKLFPHHIPIGDDKHGKARDAFQVLANGGPFGLLAVVYGIVLLCPHFFEPSAQMGEFRVDFTGAESWVLAAMLVSMATATADTWSSEFGQYFAGKTYDLLRLKVVDPGLSGGVSWAGSLAGLLGASLIAISGYFLLPAFQLKEFFFITLLGFGGMLVDSLLGSAFQRQYFDGSQWSDQPIGHAKGSIQEIPR
ncbi:MAG: DUF92 domain-containing protein, partial [Bacteroidota bacterium]